MNRLLSLLTVSLCIMLACLSTLYIRTEKENRRKNKEILTINLEKDSLLLENKLIQFERDSIKRLNNIDSEMIEIMNIEISRLNGRKMPIFDKTKNRSLN